MKIKIKMKMKMKTRLFALLPCFTYFTAFTAFTASSNFLTAARRPAIPIAIEDRGYGRAPSLRPSAMRLRRVPPP
jgi:hypothetical protein